MQQPTLFVDVILPVSVGQLFTYRVPRDLNDKIKKGVRVVVQFGKAKRYSALIRHIHDKPPKGYEAKYIDEVLDDEPIVNDIQFKLWDWVVDYYMCTPGEVMVAALPGSLRLASETRIILNTSFVETDRLTDKEFLVFQALEVSRQLTLSDITAVLDIQVVQPVVKSMLEKGAVMVEEEMREKFKPKTTDFVRLHASLNSDDAIRQTFDRLARAPKQLEILMGFLHLSKHGEKENLVSKKELLEFAGAGTAVLNNLIEKKVLEIFEIETGRLKEFTGDIDELKILNISQEKALAEVRQNLELHQTCLLNGVTGSGKTELYIALIEEYLQKGKQVLYLLPEIALTAQIVNRLQKHFGDKVGVYHSKFNQQERAEIWREIQSDSKRFRLILGARSSIWLPFHHLGLVIVDEEHDQSYKQFNPAPRYHARDTAIVLAALHKARVLLGSATPSLESYLNARNNKYGYTELKERFGGIMLPEVLIADLKKEAKEKSLHMHFSSFLIKHIEESLNAGEQVILFQNRRGYSSLWDCDSCGWTPECTQCDVSLTYHKHIHLLICHYCGNRYKPPEQCPKCSSTRLSMHGFGTEKIEDILPDFFPDVRVARMDYDSTRSKNAHHNIISRFEAGEIDVLVGTQMVTKGLDFDNVSLVGVMNADQMLNFPDFRSFERAFQLLMQVAGRAGRKGKRGRVVIQTWQPYHWIIQKVIENDYDGMAVQELQDRRQFKYPPYYRMVNIVLRHRDRNLLDAKSAQFAKMLRVKFADRILGPEYLPVARVKNRYQKQIILKLEKQASFKEARKALRMISDEFYKEKANRSIRISLDVDPV
jgi:primosomal protein N' (replication factor Y)